VPYRRLLSKLRSYGVEGILEWIENFLIGRKQKVTVGDAESNWTDVSSGVPQGSVLGPILFVIYINDLPENVSSNVKMFADDTKLYKHINNEDDCRVLQEDLTALQRWSSTWLLRFNASKCKRMHMGHGNMGVEYQLGEESIPHGTEEKDLGVIITEDTKTSRQCSAASVKAMTKLRIIKRSFKYFDNTCFTMLYKTYIRPQLEYCIQAWSLKTDIEQLEKVQRRATKLIPSLRDKPYHERLKELKLYSLETRRKRGDLIETYKILNGLEGIEENKLFTRNTNPFQLRGHEDKLFKPALKKGLNSRKNFFSTRVISEWNNLPAHVVNTKTTNQFKNQLDAYWKKTGYGGIKA